MKVLVTGAGGFIGRAVAAALARAGHAISVTDRPGVDLSYAASLPSLGGSAGSSESFELRDTESLAAFSRGHDAIVHVAGLFDLGAPLSALRHANVDSVKQVVDVARSTGVRRVIHLSTVGVYGRPRRTPCPETESPRPRQNYERTKAEGEAIAQAAKDLGVTILRPTIVYGPHSRYGFGVFIGRLYLTLSQAKTSLRVMRGSPRMHAVHVDDVAGAVAFCLERSETAGSVFNVADDTPCAAMEVLGCLGQALGLEVRADIGYVPWLYRFLLWTAEKVYPDRAIDKMNLRIERRWKHLAGDLGFLPAFIPKFDRDWFGYLRNDHVYDNGRLKALGFRYSHPELLTGLRQTLQWYRDSNWLPAPEHVAQWAQNRKQPGVVPAKGAHAPP